MTNEIPNLTENNILNFWAKVTASGPDDCWEWLAQKNKGYGVFGLGGKHFFAHRVSYFIANGSFPNNKPHCLHSCDNPGCVNPSHLYAGTPLENARDRTEKGRHNAPRGDAHYSRVNPERMVHGEAHRSAKLTKDKVLEIRRAYDAGGVFQRELGQRFGVARGVISRIILRKIWKHVA